MGGLPIEQERMSRQRQQRSVELSMPAVAEIVLPQTFTLYGKRPLRKRQIGICVVLQKSSIHIRYGSKA